MNRSFKTEASLILKPGQSPNTCIKQTNDMQNTDHFVDSAPIPFSWESGNQLMNRFLKIEASLILKPGQSPSTCVKQTNDMQNIAQLFFQ